MALGSILCSRTWGLKFCAVHSEKALFIRFSWKLTDHEHDSFASLYYSADCWTIMNCCSRIVCNLTVNVVIIWWREVRTFCLSTKGMSLDNLSNAPLLMGKHPNLLSTWWLQLHLVLVARSYWSQKQFFLFFLFCSMQLYETLWAQSAEPSKHDLWGTSVLLQNAASKPVRQSQLVCKKWCA